MGRPNGSVDYVGLKNISAGLLASGWTRSGTITHPFLMDSFTKDARQIRLEHDRTPGGAVQTVEELDPA